MLSSIGFSLESGLSDDLISVEESFIVLFK